MCEITLAVTPRDRGGDRPPMRILPAAAPFGAKLHTPPLRTVHVDRRGIQQRLRSHRGVILVVAPPGFGKTTLLSRWEQLDERPFGWLSLDAGDNDPVVFWSYVKLAIRMAMEQAATGVTPGSEEFDRSTAPGDVTKTSITGMLNAIGATGSEIVLVIEDWHWITNPEVLTGLSLLLTRHPANMTIALSARSDPAIPLGRLRVRPDLLELRVSVLSFTLEETNEFLNSALGLGLSPEAVRTLWVRTEGWPAGLYLAYLSMRELQDREAFVRQFRGSSRHVIDYLTEVVVEALDDLTRGWLLRTSILDRMSGALCDAVTGSHDSADRLDQLEHANLFLIPLDDRREWYRYHRLFREGLRDELLRRHPDEVPELHRRASAWLAQAGYTTDAIRHALEGGDTEAATLLVSENYLKTLEWGGLATIAGWIGRFDRQVVTSDARLSVVEAWVKTFQNRYEETDLALENALRAGFAGKLPDGSSSVEASAALIRASAPRGDVGHMLAAARKAFELEGQASSMWQVTTHVQLGWALLLSGDPGEAKPYLERAARQAPMTEQWLDAFGARSLLAWAGLQEGRVTDAEEWALSGVGVIESHGLGGTSAADFGYATLGAVRARQGRTDEAADLLDPTVERMRSTAPPLVLAKVLIATAPVRRARGAAIEARELLDEARAIIDDCVDPGVLGEHLERAAKTLTPSYRRVSGEGSLTERELEVLRLLEKGLSKSEIARTLYLSFNTVHSHTKSIYRKLTAFNRDEAIRRAREDGLI
jgi:LuxR family maltose regulon positive regulatory protein